MSAIPGQAQAETSNTPHEEHLCRFAGKRAEVIGTAADEIERQLGEWRGEDRA